VLAENGGDALAAVEAQVPDLILLDLGLPDLDGVAVCRQLRAGGCPAVIVVLTARSDELDVVVALDAGADDYLTKPIRLTELLARLRAHLRRQSTGVVGTVAVGALRIEPAGRRATVAGGTSCYGPRNSTCWPSWPPAGELVTRDDLMAQVWDEHWFGSTKTLDVHVSVLRRKLAEVGEEPGPDHHDPGPGYRYETSPGRAAPS